jgi:hypothetical protein
MMIKLTHPDPNYDLWIHYDEIVMMERYARPKSVIITENSNKDDVTALVLKNGKIIACKEKPAEINVLVEEAKAKDRANAK